MVFRLFMDQFVRWSAYKLAFGFAGLSYIFYFLSQPWIQFASIFAGFLCLLGGLFFPLQFDRWYRNTQSLLLGIVSFFVSCLILLGYLLVWRPFSFLLPSKEKKG
ncbi:hypothetical protein EHO59_12030 [Leptospira semungkisensis]|uniref:Uncharacterized protein n=1 Tax=Leptospira semungkisensis TaxID=2484985 RepID=A0A4R9FR74_9LEPT|nr:hypothetical protein [Leptospira semungkisensis]TGK00670.1 hypothetical protein EHO59_12030 [Leptospira semungkisensis]